MFQEPKNYHGIEKQQNLCVFITRLLKKVTHDTEPYSIYAGVPAKKIRDRFESEEILRQHLEGIRMN
ncbi:hypothetical protein EII32_02650 [Prevotella sp. OH937_COT-195]|nr:hypothetical protein EII32_02650 [Prevotella sp. OH937_COT-195]